MTPVPLGLTVALVSTFSSPAVPLSPRGPSQVAVALGRSAGPSTARGGPRSRGTAALSAAEQRRRDRIVQALIDADAEATERPETAEPGLRRALSEFAAAAPLVANDEQAQTARIYALLALARTLLVSHQDTAAANTIDEALHVARDDALPVAQFGPALERLHDARVDALAGLQPGTLVIECTVPCKAWLNERPIEPGTHALPVGPYRVWIEAEVPNLPVVRETARIRKGETVSVRYELDPSLVDASDRPPKHAVAERPDRTLPRWASIVGVSVGAGLVGTGAALVAVDRRCPDLADPRSTPCANILNTDGGGWATLGVGGAMLISAAVILAVDEIRLRRARKGTVARRRSIFAVRAWR